MVNKFFDFNIHPNFDKSCTLEKSIRNEFSAPLEELIQNFSKFIDNHQNNKNLIGFNYMIFSSHFEVDNSLIDKFYEKIYKKLAKTKLKVSFTHLINPNLKNPDLYIEKLALAGIKFIKFHSYHQKIDSNLYTNCIEISKIAAKHNIGICVDASFGTKFLYKYDNLELAANILINISSVPVIILHMGGLRALEAALLIQDTPNGFMELSFSPFFYKGLYTYNFLKDALKLTDTTRILHASDYPYVDLKNSINSTKKLITSCNFSKEDSEKIFFRNALELLKD